MADSKEAEKAAKKELIRKMQEQDQEDESEFEFPVEPEKLDNKDGSYTIEVIMEGGTGRASIDSPAVITVKDGVATARICWSSEHYDYMIVNEEKFLPINEDGNSIFEIPVYVYDQKMPVIVDTTAMEKPHEIEYTLYFQTETIKSVEEEKKLVSGMEIIFTAAAILLLGAFTFARKRKKQ